MPAQDMRTQPSTRVPLSGWCVTGLPTPDVPDDGAPLSGMAIAAWNVYWTLPVSVVWGPAERVLLKRLSELAHDYHSARLSADAVDDNGKPIGSAAQASRISTEMRNLEAQLGITPKGRRELKLEHVPDADFLRWYADPDTKKSTAIFLPVFSVGDVEEESAQVDELDARRQRFG